MCIRDRGRIVDFKNTVVIMTSNIGSAYLTERIQNGGSVDEETRNLVTNELKKYMKPEFINRIDDIVVFKPLGEAETMQIVRLQFALLQKRLEERNIVLNLSDEACKYIVEHSYDSAYGARPIKRFIQRTLETDIGRRILQGEIRDNSKVDITVDENGLKYETAVN